MSGFRRGPWSLPDTLDVLFVFGVVLAAVGVILLAARYLAP